MERNYVTVTLCIVTDVLRGRLKTREWKTQDWKTREHHVYMGSKT